MSRDFPVMAGEENGDMIDARVLHWAILDASGWQYLLPRALHRRWLCIDVAGGATAILLAGLCDELHVVTATAGARAEIAMKLRIAGVRNACLVDSQASAESVATSWYDGFILHDLCGVLDGQAITRWLRVARERLAPHGFVYVALRNRYGYTRLGRWLSADTNHSTSTRGWSTAGAVQRRLGCDDSRTVVYPLISNERGRLLEIVPEAGYISAKNPCQLKERIRCWLLRRRAAQWSPAFAVIAARDCRRLQNRLELVLGTLVRHGCVQSRDEMYSLVKRYYVLNGGKVIVSVGEMPGKFGSHVAVLAHSPEVVARRRHEADLLTRLVALPAPIARRIPRFFYEDEADGTRVFVLQEFPGITVDRPVDYLDDATIEAASFLVDLHRATRRVEHLTPERFRERFGTQFNAARKRYPDLSDEIDRLEEALRAALIGAKVPVVWMHGDYKIENIVLAERAYRMLGVIDWEFSDPDGLPLLDLWYLLVYNRQIGRSADFLEVVLEVLVPERRTGLEATLCAEYVDALAIPPRLMPALAGALVLHHVATRMEYDAGDRRAMMWLRSGLEEIIARLDLRHLTELKEAVTGQGVQHA